MIFSRFITCVFIFMFFKIKAQEIINYPTHIFTLPVSVSIRALEVVNDSTVWFAANRGVFGYTSNSGRTWVLDSVSVNNFKPDFRSIAVLKNGSVLLLNAGTPSFIIKIIDKDLNRKTVYTNADTLYFYDALKFRTEKSGAALADPVKGCFKIIVTNDAGETWKELPCIEALTAHHGEACFAASNSSWDFYKKHIWIGTGGKTSRIFHSDDFGSTFTSVESPIKGGNQLSGIFSLDFLDDKTGIIAGGNYDTTKVNDITFAFTTNGGTTWTVPKNDKPFFVSCAQIAKRQNEVIVFVVGHNGVFFSNNMGSAWGEVTYAGAPLKKFNTLRFSSSGKSVWLAGNKGAIGKIDLQLVPEK
jgi:photosystem II stability/assembly factor-like uncharacterized protein